MVFNAAARMRATSKCYTSNISGLPTRLKSPRIWNIGIKLEITNYEKIAGGFRLKSKTSNVRMSFE